MPAELIAAGELSKRDLTQWRELAGRALEPNPFFEPDYVLPLAAGLGCEEEVWLLVVRDRDEWRACMPVHVQKRWHGVPLRSLATWLGHPLYGLLGTPLIAPERCDESLAELLEGIPGSVGAKFGSLERVRGDGPLGRSLARLLEERRPAPLLFERYERAALRRRPEPTYIEETLSSKHRRELRRLRRKLGEELGGEPTVIDLAGDEDAYADFVALEAAAGSLAESGTVIAADPGHVAFFTGMCRSFASRGRLQLLALQAGDQTVAMKCNLVAGSTIFFFKIAYDERWSAYSPGILLELEMLKLFHENSDVDSMDSCADANNVMINRLWPDRRELTTHLLPASGPSGRATRPVLAAARSLRDFKRERRNR